MDGKTPEATDGIHVNRGGRPTAFPEPTDRLNVLLPAGMVRAIRQEALEQSQPPGQVVATKLASTYLAVTFQIETIMPYSDSDSPKSIEVSSPKHVNGYLTLETLSGYKHFIATDDRGSTMDLSKLSLVYPRGSTTTEALGEMVDQLPMELIASRFPCPD